MSSINVLMIPTNSCNMKCIYCFHNEHNENNQKMEIKCLEKAISILQNSFSNINYVWHGGEPLLMGESFFANVVQLQEKYKKKYDVIRNGIQTNLTLLTDEMASFLVNHSFDIGSSFDGIMNEMTRGMSKEILEGRNIIIKHGGSCGMIQVVSKVNVCYLIESYELCKEKNIPFSINLFIEDSSNKNILGLDVNEYINKVNELFDVWLYDEKYLRVTQFQEIISFILFSKKYTCAYNSCLGRWVSIRPNGDIYPCNRYFSEKYCYGNVFDYEDIKECFFSQGFNNILFDAIERRKKCIDCSIYKFCEGGCNNNALYENGIQNNNGKSCIALKQVFEHIKKTIDYIINYNLDLRTNKWVQKNIKEYRKQLKEHADEK